MSYWQQQSLSGRAVELQSELLTSIPKIERVQYVNELMNQYRYEQRVMQASRAGTPQYRLPSHALHTGGIKTSKMTTDKFFSTPGSVGQADELMLQKQRKAERKALTMAGKKDMYNPGIGRRLPW